MENIPTIETRMIDIIGIIAQGNTMMIGMVDIHQKTEALMMVMTRPSLVGMVDNLLISSLHFPSTGVGTH
jgi:hypothetical protein